MVQIYKTLLCVLFTVQYSYTSTFNIFYCMFSAMGNSTFNTFLIDLFI